MTSGKALRRLCLLGAALAAATAPSSIHGQSAQLGAAPISHVGVVVRDADTATKHFADVMGVAAPKVIAVQLPLPDGSRADIRYATVQLPNLVIEFEQPTNTIGPLHDHLQKFGQSLHHIGIVVADGVDETRAHLEERGGKWVGGTKGGSYAFVDLKDSLGATIEIVRGTYPPANAPAAVPPTDAAPLGRRAISHIGIAVTDAETAARAWSEALGVPMPVLRDYKDSQYPPGHPWSMDAFIRLAAWKQVNVGVQLVGAVGRPNPWSDYVERFKGSVLQHIALPVGPRMAETIVELQKKGGKWTNGKTGGQYAYLDFVDSFGIAFELNGS